MTDRRPLPRSRRGYLRGLGGVLGIGFAGCSDAVGGGADEDRETDGTPSTPNEDSTETEETPTTPTEPENDTTPTESDTTPVHTEYETTEVRVTTDGDVLGSVTAAIADTRDLRYTGLSETESLPEDRGMLFVYESEGDRTFVMREMDFGIDIVYADGEGVITRIHHAPAPGPDEEGAEQRYPGYGQYVLEVNYEWTAERGVEEGHVLEFEL